MERKKELWGHKFKIVNNGLDEAEVYSFVDSLTNQYGTLAKQLEHLDSVVSRLSHQYNNLATKLEHLDSPTNHHTERHAAELNDGLERLDLLRTLSNGDTIEVDSDKLKNLHALARFAERAINEATKRANTTETEIEEKARAKAISIVASAEEKARAEADAIIAETEMRATERGEEIIAAAQQEAQQLLEDAQQRVEAIEAPAQDDAEQKAQDILREVKKRAEESAQLAKQEADQLLAEGKQITEGEIKGVFENIQRNLLSLVEVFEEPSAKSTKKGSAVPGRSKTEAAEPVPTEETTEATTDETEEERDPEFFTGTVELALPPPVVLDRMLQLHKHLKRTPNVDVLNLGGSVDKGITIRVLVQKPTPLLKVIAKLSEVEEASEELPDADKTVPSRQTGEKTPIRRIIVTTKE